eukprot:COSAG02_NODE_19364_length_885_cov_1.655216_3_plen_55_part_01
MALALALCRATAFSTVTVPFQSPKFKSTKEAFLGIPTPPTWSVDAASVEAPDAPS